MGDPLRWKRETLRLLGESEHVARDGRDVFIIRRSLRLRTISLIIRRGDRRKVTESYNYLPSVRFAKEWTELRRRLKNGNHPPHVRRVHGMGSNMVKTRRRRK